jgi:asparagine synthase (glutamine-hydrolysing)
LSVQTGIWSFAGRTVEYREIEYLLLGLEERGPDYSAIRLCGPLAMGFRGLLIAPEDKPDQPLKGGSGVVATFDGRLDGRGELARRVGLPECTEMSDTALVLLAYAALGPSSFDYVIGEFALVLWDAPRTSLFFVRSLCGSRPLYYTISGGQIIWSSELDDLVVKSDIDPTVNHNYAISYLLFHPDIDQSPFKNISIVPCGNYVEVSHGGQIKCPKPTWHPERLSTLRLGSPEEYEEAWRYQVQRSITDRLRVRESLFSELSGGLDSSTIVSMADRVLQETGRDKARLTTVSYTYETSQDADESFFISIMEQARGRAGIHISERELAITLALEDISFTGSPDTTHNFPGMYAAVSELMKQAKARVLLNGLGGDELFGSDPTGSPELADLLLQSRFLSMISKARKWSQFGGLPLWEVLLRSAVDPLSRKGCRFLSPLRPGSIGSLLTREATLRLARPGYKLGLRIDSRIDLPSRRRRAFSVRTFRSVLSTGVFRRTPGIFVSHPLAHQHLIDFMLSLPIEQITCPGANRSLMRRATRGILPERIRARLSKAGPDEAFCRALIREHSTIRDASQFLVCERGFVSAGPLSDAVRAASLGRMDTSSSLLTVFSLERWLRSLDAIEGQRSTLKLLAECQATRVS